MTPELEIIKKENESVMRKLAILRENGFGELIIKVQQSRIVAYEHKFVEQVKM